MIGHKRWAVRTAVPQSYELKCLHAQIDQINLQMEAGNACNSPVEKRWQLSFQQTTDTFTSIRHFYIHFTCLRPDFNIGKYGDKLGEKLAKPVITVPYCI